MDIDTHRRFGPRFDAVQAEPQSSHTTADRRAHATRPPAVAADPLQTRYLGWTTRIPLFGRLFFPLIDRIRRWVLWQQSRVVVVYVLLVDLLALGGVTVTAGAVTTPTAREWGSCALLILAAVIHLTLAWTQEERRRAGLVGPHIDLTSVWTYGAVIVLPVFLAVVFTVVIRVAMYPIAHRPPFRYTFSSSSIVAACMVSSLTLNHAGHAMPALLVGGAVYWVTSAMIVAGAIHLTVPAATWRDTLGATTANLLEAASLAAAAGLMAAIFLPTPGPAVTARFWCTSLLAVITVSALIGGINRSLDEYRYSHHQAAVDPKTGLRNARGWQRDAVPILRRAQHDQRPTAVFMLDLDHFKQVNDTYGHPAGDDVLRHVAAAVQAEVRPGDIVARFGGEELQVLLPGAGWTEAEIRAEQMRQAIERLDVATSGKHGEPVVLSTITTSIGITVIPPTKASDVPGSDGLQMALQAADRALYEAKSRGRNQVASARFPSTFQGR